MRSNLPQLIAYIYLPSFAFKWEALRYFIGMGQDLWAVFRDEDITLADISSAMWAGFAGDYIATLMASGDQFANFLNLILFPIQKH